MITWPVYAQSAFQKDTFSIWNDLISGATRVLVIWDRLNLCWQRFQQYSQQGELRFSWHPAPQQTLVLKELTSPQHKLKKYMLLLVALIENHTWIIVHPRFKWTVLLAPQHFSWAELARFSHFRELPSVPGCRATECYTKYLRYGFLFQLIES